MRSAALTVLGATVLVLAGGALAAPAAGAGGTTTSEARAGVTAAGGTRSGGATLPSVIALPNGFQPEGIATGRAGTFYAGSLKDGAIYRGTW